MFLTLLLYLLKSSSSLASVWECCGVSTHVHTNTRACMFITQGSTCFHMCFIIPLYFMATTIIHACVHMCDVYIACVFVHEYLCSHDCVAIDVHVCMGSVYVCACDNEWAPSCVCLCVGMSVLCVGCVYMCVVHVGVHVCSPTNSLESLCAYLASGQWGGHVPCTWLTGFDCWHHVESPKPPREHSPLMQPCWHCCRAQG